MPPGKAPSPPLTISIRISFLEKRRLKSLVNVSPILTDSFAGLRSGCDGGLRCRSTKQIRRCTAPKSFVLWAGRVPGGAA